MVLMTVSVKFSVVEVVAATLCKGAAGWSNIVA